MTLVLYKITTVGKTVVADNTTPPSGSNAVTPPANLTISALADYYRTLDRNDNAFHPANAPSSISEQTVSNGIDGLSAILSNDNVSLSSASDGTVNSFANSGTNIYIYEGTTPLTYDGIGTSKGTWKIDITPTAVNVPAITNNTNHATTAELTSFSADVGKLTFTISGTNSFGVTFSLVKIQNFTKAKNGTIGSNGASPGAFSIDNSFSAFNKDANGVLSPNALILSTTAQNITAITSYKWQKNGVDIAGANSSTLAIVANTDYPFGTTNNTYKCIVTGTINGVVGASLNHSVTIPVLTDGKAYIVVIESTNGTSFKVGQGKTTILKAYVFLNGVDVTNTIDQQWFKWRRVSTIILEPPNDDTTWDTLHSGYKQVGVNVDDVSSQASFFCDIINPN